MTVCLIVLPILTLSNQAFSKTRNALSNIIHTSNTWEKAMAPHSSTLAWEIPWTEKPGRLQSMGSLGVGHD